MHAFKPVFFKLWIRVNLSTENRWNPNFSRVVLFDILRKSSSDHWTWDLHCFSPFFFGIFASQELVAVLASFGDFVSFLSAVSLVAGLATGFLAKRFLAFGFAGFFGVSAFFGLAALGFFAGLAILPNLNDPEMPVPLDRFKLLVYWLPVSKLQIL